MDKGPVPAPSFLSWLKPVLVISEVLDTEFTDGAE